MSFFSNLMGGSGRLDSTKAHALVDEGAILLDVRTPGEFAGGHVDGAKNIPVQELGNRHTELDRKATYVLYCRSGARSANAKRFLEMQGFESVHDLGSIANW